MANFSNRQVLGSVGNPRLGGNTEILVDEVLLGAENAGCGHNHDHDHEH